MAPKGPDNIEDALTALVDGELNAADAAEALEHLAAHPEAMEALRERRRAEAAVVAAISLTPPPSDRLREAVRAMADAERPQRGAGTKTFCFWKSGLAVAASLLVGLGLGAWLLKPAAPVAHAGPVPASLVAQASLVHADCSRLAEGLHAADYPQDFGELSQAVRDDVAVAQPNAPRRSHPDLSSVGLKFIGAGPCAAPLRRTVHLLYYNADGGPRKAVSVFAQPFVGQFDLKKGQFYLVSAETSPFPVYAWRTDKVVYFLVADNAALANEARSLLVMDGSSPAGATRPVAASVP